MDHMSSTELRGACPHCGQHFVCDPVAAGHSLRCPACEREFMVPEAPAPSAQSATGPLPEMAAARHFRCPRCSTQLGVFEPGKNPTDCPRCGWHHAGVVSEQHPELPATPVQRLATGAGLLIIGVASPFLVFISMALTMVTGPLALVLAPALGLVCGNFLCRTVYERTGPRWYWYYVASGLVVPLLILLWPGHHHPGGSGVNESAAFAMPAIMVVTLLLGAGMVCWLVAAIYAWFKAHPLE
jgi:hypothetical protein